MGLTLHFGRWIAILALGFAHVAYAHDACDWRLQAHKDTSKWTADYPHLAEQYAQSLTLIKQQEHPTLSIVVPAFREEQRITNSIREMKAFFDAFPFPVEILVRIEKSPDKTVEVAEAAVAGDPRFVISGHPVQRGKGYAVRQGMLAARGDLVLFMDTDLSTPLPEIFHFLSLRAQGQTSPVMIGDRHHSESKIEADQSFHRQIMGSVFRGLIQRVLRSYGLSGINDTQCGFKLFTAEASNRLFNMAQVDGFAFDIEVLLLASELGMDIQAVPILWHDDPRTTVHPILDPLKMLRDVIQMRPQVRSLIANSPQMEPI
ncbi:MAG: dolichyl-phosphate beta-glucosyltransferase [Bdellovibrionales bacterium]